MWILQRLERVHMVWYVDVSDEVQPVAGDQHTQCPHVAAMPDNQPDMRLGHANARHERLAPKKDYSTACIAKPNGLYAASLFSFCA